MEAMGLDMAAQRIHRHDVSLRVVVRNESIHRVMVGLVMLNTLLLLYSHFGTSGVVMSNLKGFNVPRILAQDAGCIGEELNVEDLVRCGGRPGSLIDCLGVSADCSPSCVAPASFCAANSCSGCSDGKNCSECFEKNCKDDFPCLGRLLQENDEPSIADSCSKMEVLYEVQFFDAISKAWNGGAEWLALVLCIASGIWPYLKNILIFVIWEKPLDSDTRGQLLSWLSRLGRWSYVDVFIMILLNTTLKVEKLLSTKLLFLVVSYPKPGVYAFCVAATCSLIQSEYLKSKHNDFKAVEAAQGRVFSPIPINGRLRNFRKSNAYEPNKPGGFQGSRLLLYLPWIPILLIIAGFFPLDLITFSLRGTVSFLPGENKYTYSCQKILGSTIFIGSSYCGDEAWDMEFGRLLLFLIFFLGVLVFPILCCLTIGLSWLSQEYGFVRRWWIMRRLQCMDIARVIELLNAFACLDVFVLSFLIVIMEVGKVVKAVGEASTIAGVDVDMGTAIEHGGYVLVSATVIYWLTMFFHERKVAEGALQGEKRAVPIDIEYMVDQHPREGDLYDDVGELDEDEAETLSLFNTTTNKHI